MEFTEPSSEGYTIYSKSGCTYCTKVKELLKILELPYVMINCDEYLLEDRDGFLAFIQERAGKEYKTFPMVFADGKFLGGFAETKMSLVVKSD
jgi:thioredoxin reductase (NADPH)/glutaredoxin 3